MMITYEKVQDDISGKLSIKRINDDGTQSWIPVDEANSDYQQYLKSLDEAATL